MIMTIFFSSCAKQKIHINEKIKKQTAAMGINLEDLEEGKACKYIGFIGNNSVAKARENGKIKFLQFNYTDGNFLRKCTYAFGKL